MPEKGSSRKVVIIGAGAAGAAAAYHLAKAGHEVVLIEKNDHAGGKCSTYTDPRTGEQTELGAVLISPNYPLEIMRDLNIKPRTKLPLPPTETQQRFYNAGFWEKLNMGAQYLFECALFAVDVYRYRCARDSNADLPADLDMPFSEYIKDKNIEVSMDLYKGFLPGCGYGDFREKKTFEVLEYLGYTTVPMATLPNGVKEVDGGYQGFIEAMAARADQLLTSATVTNIERDPSKAQGGVSVTYQVGEKTHTIEADDLFLTVPPHQYDQLGMSLTEAEENCITSLETRPYPVAVCRIKGLGKNYSFFFDALHQEGFDHMALITTRDERDNPEDGRLCTVYFNTNKQHDIDFENHEALVKMIRSEYIDELLKQYRQSLAGTDQYALEERMAQYRNELEQVVEVAVDEVKVWQDYGCSLPYQQRQKMHVEQGRNHTYYAGAAFSHDNVGPIIDFVKRLLDDKFLSEAQSTYESLVRFNSSLESMAKNLFFYYDPKAYTPADVDRDNAPVLDQLAEPTL